MNRDERQRAVWRFVSDTFGLPSVVISERIARLVEEVAELAQAEDFPIEKVKKIVDYVYARPKGEPFQEVGGIELCILAYCETANFSAEKAEQTEFERVTRTSVHPFRERQAAKALAGVTMTKDKP